VLFLAGCASSSHTQPPSGSQSLAVSPATATVRGDASLSLTLSPAGSPAVSWYVDGTPGGNSALGRISSAGQYVAPEFPPATNSITITAVEVANSALTASAAVTLQNPLPQISSISPTSIPVGAFSITVTGAHFAPGAVIDWSGVALTTTRVSSTQLTAQGTATTAQVGNVPVTVMNPDPGQVLSTSINAQVTAATSGTIQVTPASATVRLGGLQQFQAAVTGNTNQSVTWSISNQAAGSSALGTISATGDYQAPATLPTSSSATITATSVADPTQSSSAVVALENPVPAVASVSPNSLTPGAFTLTVTGTGFVAGSVINFAGGALTTSFVSPGELTASGSSAASLPSQIPVLVQNPNPGGAPSNTFNIAFTSTGTPTASPATPTAAARFLDQSSFGPTAATIAHVQQIGLQNSINEQFNQGTTLFSEPPSPDTAVCGFTNWRCTQSEFVNVATWGNDQLRQRVAMALSEIFVAPINRDNAMPFYLNTLANDAFSNYRTIMQDVALSPAMGDYLNMLNSGKPATGQIANENFARENMQLFTLGLYLLNSDGSRQTDSSGNPIPTYTELQVEAFARAYTGWTNANTDGTTPAKFNYTANWFYFMVPVETKHDTTEKILLNGTALPAGQSAEDDLNGALDNIFAHPNIGPFVSRQLIQHLVSGNPSPAYVARVSAVFANNGSGVRGDMKAVLTAILMDPEARAGDVQTGDQADAHPAVDGGHLREPLLWTENLLRGLNATPQSPATPYPYVSFMSSRLASLGEAPFNQASVFNYFPPEYVIPQTTSNAPEFSLENTGSVVPRLSLADAIIHNTASGPAVDLSATSPFGLQASDPATLVDYLGMLFMHSQMPTDMRTALITTVSAIPATDLQSRVRVAVYLVVTSSQYKIMH
jgi:uncharacterized protein (DUF1800 family)